MSRGTTDITDIFVGLLDRPRRLHILNITVTPWTGIGRLRKARRTA